MNTGMPVESPVRGDSHAGFGGRPAETERPKGRHRAAGRPYRGGKPADRVRRDQYNQHGRSASGEGQWIKGTRYSLLKDTASQTAGQLLKLAKVVIANQPMYRAFLLYGELRYIDRLPREDAAERLDAWPSRSRLKPFIKLGRTIRKHKLGVLAAIQLNISNRRRAVFGTVLKDALDGGGVVVLPIVFRIGRCHERRFDVDLSLFSIDPGVRSVERLGQIGQAPGRKAVSCRDESGERLRACS